MTSVEATVIRRSTGCVDSYPCWDNEMHKKYKLKQYKDDADLRQLNRNESDKIQKEYNEKINPSVNPDGQSKLEQNLSRVIADLASKIPDKEAKRFLTIGSTTNPKIPQSLEIESINAEKRQALIDEELGVAPLVNEDLLRELLGEQLRGIQKEAMTESKLEEGYRKIVKTLPNLSKQAIKNQQLEIASKKAFELQQAQAALEHEEESKMPVESDNSNYLQLKLNPARTEFNLSDLLGVSSSDTESISSFGTTAQQSSMTGIDEQLDFGDMNILPTPKSLIESILSHLKEATDNTINGIKYRVNTRSISYYDPNKKDKAGKSININIKDTDKNGLQALLNRIRGTAVSTNPMTPAVGLKSKTTNWYKNRFQILKGEILANNDNPSIIAELKEVSKVLHSKGLLDSHL